MKIELEKFPPEKWNDILQQIPHSTIYQSSLWGEAFRDRFRKPLYVTVRNDQEIKALLLIFKEPFRYRGFQVRKLFRSLLPVNKLLTADIRIISGPVFLTTDEKKYESLKAILEFFREIKGKKLGRIYFETPLYFEGEEFDSLFSQYGFSKNKRFTLIVNTKKNEEELWKGFKHSARKSIKRAKDKGLAIKIISENTDEHEFKNWYSFIKGTRAEQGFRTVSYEHYKKRREILGSHFKIFNAEKDDRILSSLGVWHWNKTAHEFASVQSEESKKNKVYSGDFLKYYILKWCSQNNIEKFNLGGVNPLPTATEKEKRIFQFKNKWGGEIVNYFVYSKGILH